jgi:hypothetical protein
VKKKNAPVEAGACLSTQRVITYWLDSSQDIKGNVLAPVFSKCKAEKSKAPPLQTSQGWATRERFLEFKYGYRPRLKGMEIRSVAS